MNMHKRPDGCGGNATETDAGWHTSKKLESGVYSVTLNGFQMR